MVYAMPVQAVMFVKAAPHLWKTGAVRKWLIAHNYSHAVIGRKGPHIVATQFQPVAGAAYRTVTVPGGKGIKMVVDAPKRGAKAAALAADITTDIASDVAIEVAEEKARSRGEGAGEAAGSSTSTSEFEYVVTKRRKIPRA